jgi:UDP-N-acetylmuramoylalanine--D-glutamate ligase
MEFKGKRVLVLGLGDSGLSMARYLARCGARVRVADSRVTPPHAARLRADVPDAELICGPFLAESFEGIDLIAISPGVPLAEPLVTAAQQRGVPVVGDVELFAQALKSPPAPLLPREEDVAANTLPTLPKRGWGGFVIAITGSNGKSTVTSMVGAMCRAAGLNTVVAGNIGLPVLDALHEAEIAFNEGKGEAQVYVLELSSFQLETTSSLNAAAATVLNMSEDHLDRYAGMDDYAAAKAKIFQGAGAQVLNRDDARGMAMASPGKRVFTFGLTAPQVDEAWGLREEGGKTWLVHGELNLMMVDELQVAGLHNAANALSALALCRAIDLPYAPLLQALHEFHGLPHRVEKVMAINGVTFYDDSKGTNVGATEAALNGMREKVVLIVGGDGKGQDFGPLKSAVANHARAVVLIGRDADKIGSAVAGSGVATLHAASLEDAVNTAFEQAKSGDAVLLSPACASFDMFRNYEHRAQVFVAAVKALAAQCERRAG